MDAMTPSRKDMNTSLCVQGIHSDDNHVLTMLSIMITLMMMMIMMMMMTSMTSILPRL